MRASAPFISATLIVRDEERHLPACLASLRRFADEIIVVDTGSRDRTPEIARQAGARLFEHPWRDDFSEARNVAIEHARGDWLLYIDADERVRPADMERLKASLSDPSVLCGTVRFHPRTGSTAYREYRLLRRRPDVRFQGAVHESFLTDLWRAIRRENGRIVEVDVTIDHVGYDGDQSHKLGRNRTLLEKQVVDTPDRVFLWWHLGCVYRDLGQPGAAQTAWRRGTELAHQQQGSHAEDALCFIELAKFDAELGEAALDWINQGLSLRPENLMLQWLKGRAVMETSPNEAAAIFAALAAIDPDELVAETAYDRRILGAGAWADLGYLAFSRADYARAAEAYAAASAKAPDILEYRLKHRLAAARLTPQRSTDHG